MAQLVLDNDNALHYEYTKAAIGACTFVFFNALSADLSLWQNSCVNTLQQAGHGTLLWNYRGQSSSPCSHDLDLGATTIISDACLLLDHIQPARAVMVGLSIGGLFAAQACLKGASASGLVVLNTLRKPGPRLSWINNAAVRCVEVGGMDLMKDLFGALILSEDTLLQSQPEAFKDRAYTPLAKDTGAYRLLSDSRTADWDLPYEQLQLPVLVITGLQDTLFFKADHFAELFARLPNASRADFPAAGHMVPLEQPNEFNQALLTFAQNL